MKKTRIHINSLPFDCWSRVVLFIGDHQTLQSILLSVNGFRDYCSKINVHCTQNITVQISKFPSLGKVVAPYITNIHFKRGEWNPIICLGDFFTVGQLGRQVEDESGFFRTFFEVFPNLMKLEIDLYKVSYYSIFDENYDPIEEDVEIPNTLWFSEDNFGFDLRKLDVSMLQNLVELKISISSTPFEIDQKFPFLRKLTLNNLREYGMNSENKEMVGLETFDEVQGTPYRYRYKNINFELLVNWEQLPSLRFLHLFNWWIREDKSIRGNSIGSLVLDDVEFEKQENFTDLCPNLKSIEFISKSVKHFPEQVEKLETVKICGSGKDHTDDENKESFFDDGRIASRMRIPSIVGNAMNSYCLKVIHIVMSDFSLFLPKDENNTTFRLVNLPFLESVWFEEVYDVGLVLAHIPRLKSFRVTNRPNRKFEEQILGKYRSDFYRFQVPGRDSFYETNNPIIDFNENVGVNTLKEFVIERFTRSHISLKLWKDLFSVYRSSLEVLQIHISQSGYSSPHPFFLADVFFGESYSEMKRSDITPSFDQKVSLDNFPNLKDVHLRYFHQKRVADVQGIQDCPNLKRLTLYRENMVKPFQKKEDCLLNLSKLESLEELNLHNICFAVTDLEHSKTILMNLKGICYLGAVEVILSQIEMCFSIRRMYLSGNKSAQDEKRKKENSDRFWDKNKKIEPSKNRCVEVDLFHNFPPNLEHLVLECFDSVSISRHPKLKILYVSEGFYLSVLSNPSLEKIDCNCMTESVKIVRNRKLNSYSSFKYPRELVFIRNNPEIESLNLGCKNLSEINNVKQLKTLQLCGTRTVRVDNDTFPSLEEIRLRGKVCEFDIFGLNSLKSLYWDFNSGKFEKEFLKFRIMNCQELESIDLHNFITMITEDYRTRNKKIKDRKSCILELANLPSCSSLRLGQGFFGFSECCG